MYVLFQQDPPKYGESYDKHNRKITEENDYVYDSNNKENFEIVKSHDERENVRFII